MEKKSINKLHMLVGIIALITVSSFFMSSIITELFGTIAQIKLVKEIIFYAVTILIVSMPILAISGHKLLVKYPKISSNNGEIEALLSRKKKRMRLIALNGIILVTLAAVLYFLSRKEELSTMFYMIQFIELLFGAFNISMIVLMIIDGLKLSKSKKTIIS